jgi:hypothetical protein
LKVGLSHRVLLTVVEESEWHNKTIVGGNAPFFVGKGDCDLACGSCTATLAKGMVNGQLRVIAFRCPHCGQICEQKSPPPFAVPEGRVIRFTNGEYHFGSPIECPAYFMIAGESG